MLKIISDKLSKQKLNGWQIRETQKTSYQSFLAKKDRECTRTVDSTSYSVSIHLKNEDNLGMANFRLGPSNKDDLDKMIEEGIFSAKMIKNQYFELPEQPNIIPTVEIFDSGLSKKDLTILEDRTKQSIEKEKNVRLSTTEFFIDKVHTKLINHKGLNVEQDETFVQTELILLAKSNGEEKEFINRYKRRLMSDFDLEGELAESSKYAREATQSTLPQTGNFSVLLSGEPLDNLYNPLLAKSSARLKYNKMIKTDKNKSILADGDVKGDKVTIWSNGLVKGMVGSNRFDSFGTPMGRICLVEGNILKTYLADKRYSDYLNEPVTGELGNMEIDPGKTSFADLQKPPGDKPLYHLTAFSAFEPNSITGAFSAEIRSGYEITSKGTRPIKGGSVSGILHRDLLNCLLSKEQDRRERVVCPRGILFKSLAIAGK